MASHKRKRNDRTVAPQPWAETNVETYAKRGYLDVGSDYGQMRIHLVPDSDGRLRTWKVEIWTDTKTSPALEPQWWHGRFITKRLLATAPLVAAEASANLPYQAWRIRGGDTSELPAAPAKLVVPPSSPYPEQFWRDVAGRYMELVVLLGVRNPASCIAEDTGVSVATVRGWIARSRQLGLLAKGKQGSVG
jgi:hypothetical protein